MTIEQVGAFIQFFIGENPPAWMGLVVLTLAVILAVSILRVVLAAIALLILEIANRIEDRKMRGLVRAWLRVNGENPR